MNDIYSKRPNGVPSHWWQALTAIPDSNSCTAYERLKRVWFDHTRFLGPNRSKVAEKEYEEKRTHEFVRSGHETNLTVTLWENFDIFEPGLWIPRVFELAGLAPPGTSVCRCQWSYEWVGYRADGARSGRESEAMCDVVVGYGGTECSGVLVVEAKGLGKQLGAKELNPDYYLGIKEIAEFGVRASLLFLVDEKVAAISRERIRGMPRRPGLLTWQQLGGLQIELAMALPIVPNLRRFIASAIQFQFSQAGIFPARFSAPYLADEPSMLDIDAIPSGEKQSMAVHSLPMWRF